jgi:hypothetical protein
MPSALTRFSSFLFSTPHPHLLGAMLTASCRATLRRGFAFSTSINNKNPPLMKSRNVTSLSWAHQQSMAAAAGTATATAPPSHIQVVYEPIQPPIDGTSRSDPNSSDT